MPLDQMGQGEFQEARESLENQDLEDNLGTKVKLERKEIKVTPVPKDHKESTERMEQWDLKGMMVSKVSKAHKAVEACQEIQVQLVLLDLKDNQD